MYKNNTVICYVFQCSMQNMKMKYYYYSVSVEPHGDFKYLSKKMTTPKFDDSTDSTLLMNMRVCDTGNETCLTKMKAKSGASYYLKICPYMEVAMRDTKAIS
jgi:hypothetical protein